MPGQAAAADDGWQHVGKNFLARPAGESHIVQFYEHDGFLTEAVVDFLGAGLALGEPLIAIATGPHRQAFADRLTSKGFDVAAASRTGQLTCLDAQETLSRFMVDGMPDPARFRGVLGAVIERSLAHGRHARLRAFGEMVALLWKDGNARAAIWLEELWNDLRKSYPFILLCAYAMDDFGKEVHAEAFRHICRTHSHVLPTETYSRIEDPDARLREISVLQQRARALETEIEHRKQVEKALRDALSTRDEFLSIAGHELKTPLTAIRLQVQSILGFPLDGAMGPIRERVQKISKQVGRLSTLIEELLDVSRICAGRLTLELEELDLAALVREAVDRAADAMARFECRVRVLADAPVIGRWDRVRVEQVVVNLLSNAFKYGRGNPVEVTVAGTADRARFVVRDHGIGISPEDQARIFDRFERAVSSRNFGGLGLGLWIARQIAEAHRGSIRVESGLGKGATFIVELPYGTTGVQR